MSRSVVIAPEKNPRAAIGKPLVNGRVVETVEPETSTRKREPVRRFVWLILGNVGPTLVLIGGGCRSESHPV